MSTVFNLSKLKYLTCDQTLALSSPEFRVGPQHMASHQISLVLMVTNCGAVRSFSRLKLTENRRRTSVTQERVNLVILSKESDVLHDTDCTAICINGFARAKLRKVSVLLLHTLSLCLTSRSRLNYSYWITVQLGLYT